MSEMRNLHSYHATLAANTFDVAQADLFFTFHNENVRVKRTEAVLTCTHKKKNKIKIKK